MAGSGFVPRHKTRAKEGRISHAVDSTNDDNNIHNNNNNNNIHRNDNENERERERERETSQEELFRTFV